MTISAFVFAAAAVGMLAGAAALALPRPGRVRVVAKKNRFARRLPGE